MLSYKRKIAQCNLPGVVGGGHFTHHGSGANYVCLPLNPDYEDQSKSGAHAVMYGTEYEALSKY